MLINHQASPIDVRVMYGSTYRPAFTNKQRFQKQIEQIKAARILAGNLQSNDIIDLAAAAMSFYNKLTVCDDGIDLAWIGKDYSELERRKVIRRNWIIMNQVYNETRLWDPNIKPLTIKDLILKIYWLSYLQLQDGFNDWRSKDFLNWEVIHEWLMYVYHNGTFTEQGCDL